MEDLLKEYDAHVDLYRAFTKKVRTLVVELLDADGIVVHSVSSRTKERDSFITKVRRSDRNYSRLADITDLTGIRIVTYFVDDLERVATLLRDQFDIDDANSIDKRDVLDPDRFGYISLHYVLSLRQARASLREFHRYAGLKAELQVRSILQHAWAEIEHDLGYKTAAGVPRDVRRQFSRLAGLLELADGEFAAIRQRLDTYEAEVSAKVDQAPQDVLIDKASLWAYLSNVNLAITISTDIARALHGRIGEIDGGNVEMHANALSVVGIRTLGELEHLFAERREFITRFACAYLGRPSSDTVFTATVSLLYLEYAILLEANDTDRVQQFVIATGIGRSETPQQFLERRRWAYDRAAATA